MSFELTIDHIAHGTIERNTGCRVNLEHVEKIG